MFSGTLRRSTADRTRSVTTTKDAATLLLVCRPHRLAPTFGEFEKIRKATPGTWRSWRVARGGTGENGLKNWKKKEKSKINRSCDRQTDRLQQNVLLILPAQILGCRLTTEPCQSLRGSYITKIGDTFTNLWRQHAVPRTPCQNVNTKRLFSLLFWFLKQPR